MNVRGDLQNGRHQTHGVLICLDRSLISIFSTFKCKADFKSGAAFLDGKWSCKKWGATAVKININQQEVPKHIKTSTVAAMVAGGDRLNFCRFDWHH
jgi:hypothetical protein